MMTRIVLRESLTVGLNDFHLLSAVGFRPVTMGNGSSNEFLPWFPAEEFHPELQCAHAFRVARCPRLKSRRIHHPEFPGDNPHSRLRSVIHRCVHEHVALHW